MSWLRGLAGIALFILIWEISADQNSLLLPSWIDILAQLKGELVDGRLPGDIKASVVRVAAGVALATFIALGLGVLSWFLKSLPQYLNGVVELIRPIPPIAWTPIAIVALGIGNRPAVAIVALGAFFPIWFGVLQGIREVEESHLRAAKSLGAKGLLVFTDIVVPSAIPYLVHGLRLGVGLGWFCVVAAEMMGASSGLGYGVQLSSLNLEMEKLYAYLLVIGIVGYLSNASLEWLDQMLGRRHGR
jgi:ABC-type nitrate/sulfonate/bicarbonate transport system permease component